MRIIDLENIVEAKQKYYHGSYNKHPIGTILIPGGDKYESNWSGTDFYGPLEDLRPPEKLAHKERTDSCAVPAASIIAESMLCIVLADSLLEKFGGDSVEELKNHINSSND